MKKITLSIFILLSVIAVMLAIDRPRDVDSYENYTVARLASEGVLYTEPIYWHVVMDDFDYPNYALWDSSSTTPGSALNNTISFLDSLGGGIVKIAMVTNGKGASFNLQQETMSFPLRRSWGNPDSAQVRMEYETRIMTREAAQFILYAGMFIEATAIGGSTDGVYFAKADGSTDLRGFIVFGSDDSTYTVDGLQTIAKDTWYNLKITWDGRRARFYVNGVQKGQLDSRYYGSDLADLSLKPSIQVTHGDSIARSFYIDYMKAKQRR